MWCSSDVASSPRCTVPRCVGSARCRSSRQQFGSSWRFHLLPRIWAHCFHPLSTAWRTDGTSQWMSRKCGPPIPLRNSHQDQLAALSPVRESYRNITRDSTSQGSRRWALLSPMLPQSCSSGMCGILVHLAVTTPRFLPVIIHLFIYVLFHFKSKARHSSQREHPQETFRIIVIFFNQGAMGKHIPTWIKSWNSLFRNCLQMSSEVTQYLVYGSWELFSIFREFSRNWEIWKMHDCLFVC